MEHTFHGKVTTTDAEPMVAAELPIPLDQAAFIELRAFAKGLTSEGFASVLQVCARGVWRSDTAGFVWPVGDATLRVITRSEVLQHCHVAFDVKHPQVLFVVWGVAEAQLLWHVYGTAVYL